MSQMLTLADLKNVSASMENETNDNGKSLFLGDLSCFCQEVDLIRVFQQFGEIEDVRVKRNNEGSGLGYGFVTFVNVKSAEEALAADGLVILGRPVKISWARNRSGFIMNGLTMPKSKAKAPITADSVTSAQLHFSFISKQHVHVITEATVREVFLNFGDVKDVTIKKTATNQGSGEQTGYGFVHYALTDSGIQAAIKAAKIIRQVHINQVLYDCRLTWSLEEIIARRYGNVGISSRPEAPVVNRSASYDFLTMEAPLSCGSYSENNTFSPTLPPRPVRELKLIPSSSYPPMFGSSTSSFVENKPPKFTRPFSSDNSYTYYNQRHEQSPNSHSPMIQQRLGSSSQEYLNFGERSFSYGEMLSPSGRSFNGSGSVASTLSPYSSGTPNASKSFSFDNYLSSNSFDATPSNNFNLF